MTYALRRSDRICNNRCTHACFFALFRCRFSFHLLRFHRQRVTERHFLFRFQIFRAQVQGFRGRWRFFPFCPKCRHKALRCRIAFVPQIPQAIFHSRRQHLGFFHTTPPARRKEESCSDNTRRQCFSLPLAKGHKGLLQARHGLFA